MPTASEKVKRRFRDAYVRPQHDPEYFAMETAAAQAEAAVQALALDPEGGWWRPGHRGPSLREEAVVDALTVGCTVDAIIKVTGATRGMVHGAWGRAVGKGLSPETMDKVVAVLDRGPATPMEIVKASGLSRSSIQRALRELIGAGHARAICKAHGHGGSHPGGTAPWIYGLVIQERS